MRLHLSNSITNELAIVYVATELTPGESALGETEDIEVRPVSLTEAVQMADSGEITDAISVAALNKLALERARPRR